MMISVVLIRPEHPGNIGAVARAMANFGFKDLILVDPKVNHLEEEARCRAKHAQTILEKTKILKFEQLSRFDTLVATTAKLGSDYNIPRSPLSARDFAESIKNKRTKIAILFGPEGKGLRNIEVNICDFTVTIPTNKKYPVLNLSHSVALILYEVFASSKKIKTTDHYIPASGNQRKYLLGQIDNVLKEIQFSTEEKLQTQKIVWKKLLGKSFLTKREIFALFGFFKKVKEKMK